MADRGALERALALKREGRLDEAVIALESLLAADPRDGAALAHLASCQVQRGQPALALAELDRAERESGANAFTARLRGDALYRLGRHREAARAFEEAVALGDRGTWALVSLARCRARLGDAAGAREAARRAVEREPGSAQGWIALGEIAARAGDAADAEAMFARAHELGPRDAYAHARLVEARLLQLPAEERAREIDVVIKSSGRGNRHLLGVLARLQSQLGDPAAAAAAWRRSGRPGGDAFARAQEGYALRRAGDLEGAARLLGQALLEAPHDVILFKTYVRLQRERGATAELEHTLREMLPVAGARRGAVHAELKRLRQPDPASS